MYRRRRLRQLSDRHRFQATGPPGPLLLARRGGDSGVQWWCRRRGGVWVVRGGVRSVHCEAPLRLPPNVRGLGRRAPPFWNGLSQVGTVRRLRQPDNTDRIGGGGVLRIVDHLDFPPVRENVEGTVRG